MTRTATGEFARWKCVYCGSHGQIVCEKHRDLVALDVEWWGHRPFRRWWLKRFTHDEIHAIAFAFEAMIA